MKIDRKGLVFVLVLALLFYTLGSVMGANMNMGMIYHAQAGSGDGGTWNVSGTDIYLNETYTEVGIGITSPTYELHVVGDIFASAFFGDGGNLTNISGVGGNVFDQDLNTTNDVVFNSTTSSFHGDGGNLTNVSATIPDTYYGSFYLAQNGLSSIGAGEQVLLLNATSKNSDDTVFYLNNNWVTINHTGTFLVTGECYWNSGGSTRSEYTMWLRELTDDEILGTRSGIYARGYDSGSTGAFSIIIDVTSGDQYCLAIELTDGAGSSGYQDDYGTRLTFVEL